MLYLMERCQRGRMGRPAKALSGFNRTVGSNPTLSAMRVIVVWLVAGTLGIVVQPQQLRAACTPSYSVNRDDSWWSIAESEGVTLKSLLRINNASASTLLRPKDQICLPLKPSQPMRYTSSQILQIIRDVWPDDLEDRAIAIARRESKLQPGAIGIPNKCCYGLFQIYYKWHRSWLPKIGVTSARELLDPRLNAIAALEIYRRNGGWGPWE
jgi:hypothetical protein